MNVKWKNVFAVVLTAASVCVQTPGGLYAVSADTATEVDGMIAADENTEADWNTGTDDEVPESGDSYREELFMRVEKQAPQNCGVTATGHDSVTLAWEAASGASGYQIEYCQDGGDYTKAGTVESDVLTFQCTGLLTDVEYQFRIGSLDESGAVIKYSQSVTAKPYLEKTAFISSSAVGMQAAAMEWTPVDGAETYYLYRKAAGETSYKLLAKVKETKYEDKTVSPGAVYRYKVRAVRRINGKNAKAKLSASCRIKMAVSAMSIGRCEGKDYRTAELEWTQAESAAGYYVYRSVKETGTYRKIKTIKNADTLQYTDTGIVPGKYFYYKIAAYYRQNDGSVTAGELSQARKVKTQMDAPVFTAVKQTANPCLGLAWEKAANASGYRIYRSQSADKGFQKIADLSSGAMVGYEDRAVTPGVTYYYRIKALFVNKSYKGLSQPSDIISGTLKPSAPGGITVEQNGTDSLTISWQSCPGAQTYRVYRSEKADAESFECVAEQLTDTGYQDEGLNPGSVYYYRISAVGALGEGALSHAVSYEVGGVSLNTRTLKLSLGAVKPLVLSTYREGVALWTSSDAKVAIVAQDGTVTAVGTGTAVVTVAVAGKSASATISVTPGQKNGIDVSVWQKNVDWYQVKESGVDFAFLRISNHFLQDYTFETKYADATAAGIPLGVYCYSRATTVQEARQEAELVIQILNGREIAYPIAMDLEDNAQKKLSKTQLSEMILAFQETVEDAGYQFVLYSYVTFLNQYVDTAGLDGIELWIARYRSLALGTGYTGAGNVRFWQYNSGQYSGSDFHVDGVTDETGGLVNVDVNLEY